MTQENIQTLYQLLNAAHCQFMVFDIGRRITEIDEQTFVQFENCQTPYPAPIQQSAKFALVYWTAENKANPYIWFLNLPLDEESQLNTGARNHFVAIITEALGASFATDNQQQKLPDNPYIQAPDEKKLALVNAKIKQKLATAASPEYLKCASYFANPDDQSWRHLSIQGMADYLTDMSLPTVQRDFDKHYFDLPIQLQTELASLVEHNTISRALANRIIKQIRQSEFKLSQTLVNNIRILASQANTPAFKELLVDMLTSETGQSTDVLSIICARCWQAFDDDITLVAFLEHIAQLPAQYMFDSFFSDLVALPSLRNRIFVLLRQAGALPQTRLALTRMVNKNATVQ